MKPKSDDKSLEDAIRQVTGSDIAQFEEAQWKRKHGDEITLIESWKQDAAAVHATDRPLLWKSMIGRIIMRNRVTRIALLAAVAVIAITVIFWTGSGSESNVFADCLAQLRTTSYEFDIEIEIPPTDSPIITPEGTVLELGIITMKGLVLEPGKLRLEQHLETGDISTVLNSTTKQALRLFHRQKVAKRLDWQQEAGGARFLFLPAQSVEELWKLKPGAEMRLGEKEIDGKLAVGFRVTEKDELGTRTVDVWAEVATGRPLTIDIVSQSAEQGSSTLKVSMKNFKPVDNLDPSLFDTAIPQGYIQANHKTLEQLAAPQEAGPAPGATSAEAEKILKSIALCAAGQKQEAVDLLMTVDFNAEIRFGPEHYFYSMSEAQYISLTEDERNKTMEEIFSQIRQYRGLARELLARARAARESEQLAKAQSYYTVLVGLARPLSHSTDGLLITPEMGFAYGTVGLEGLAEIYQATDQPEKLESVRQQLEEMEELQKRLKERKKQLQGVF